MREPRGQRRPRWSRRRDVVEAIVMEEVEQVVDLRPVPATPVAEPAGSGRVPSSAFEARIVRMRFPNDHVVHGIRALTEELAPQARGSAGYAGGCSLMDGRTGRAIAFTVWSGGQSMRASGAAEGSLRSVLEARLEVASSSVEYADLIGQHRASDRSIEDGPAFARVTWVSGLSPDAGAEAAELHAAFRDEYVTTPGFVGSFWCLSAATGIGWSISLWDSPVTRIRSTWGGARRLGLSTRRLRAHFDGVQDYEVVDLEVPTQVPLLVS
jgi:hypothetical protein